MVIHRDIKDRENGDEKSFTFVDKFVFSNAEKEKNGFLVVKSVADLVASQRNTLDDIKRFDEYMNLHVGRWNNVQSDTQVKIKLDDGTSLKFGNDKVKHYAYMNIISQSISCDIKNKPKKTSIIDMSKSALLFKKDAQDEIIKSKIHEIYIKPIIAQATQEIDAKYGDPMQLPEEAVQQRTADIDMLVSSRISEDVKEMMESKKTNTERLLRKLHEIAHMKNNMDFIFEEGIDYAVTCSVEAYRPRFGLGEVYMKSVSPKDLYAKLSYDSIFIDDGLFASERRYLSPMEIISEHYHTFKNKDFKELEKMFTVIPDTYGVSEMRDITILRNGGSMPQGDTVINIPITGGGIDRATEEFRPWVADGRNGMLWAENMFGKLNQAMTNRNMGIESVYTTWRWNAKGKMVTRAVGDRRKEYLRGENYTFDPASGDLDIRNTVYGQTYEAEIIGNTIYANMQPVPCQQRDPHDKSKPRLGVIGAYYNTMVNNVKNVSLMAPAMPYQLRFSALNEKLAQSIDSNLGDVLLVNKKTANGQYGIQGFFDLLYKLKVIIAEDSGFGERYDPSNIRNIQLTSGIDANQTISLIQYYKGMMAESMMYNPAKLGQLGQYENQANIQASLSATDRQLYRYYSINLQVQSRVNDALAWGAFYAYRDNEEIKENYLDDVCFHHYNENYDEVAGSKVKIETTSSIEEAQTLMEFKNFLKQYMSTGGDLDRLAEGMEAKDMSTAKDVGKAARLYREKQQAEERQHQQDLTDKNISAQKEEAGAIRAQNEKIKMTEFDVKRESSYLSSLQLQKANDVNMDQINDAQQRDEKKFEFEAAINEDNNRLKKQLSDDKLEVERIKIKESSKKTQK